MTTFFLLRHAAHDNLGRFLAGRMDGIHLGPDGRAQAERLAHRLQREPIKAIYASPRERTHETAILVAKAAGIADVNVSDALDEIDFGAWSGCSFEQLNQDPQWRYWNAARILAATPAGETMLMVQTRMVAFLRDLHMQRAAASLAIVSHADVIKSAVMYYLGLGLDAWPRFDIAPASITILKLEGGCARVTLLNESVG